MSLIRTILALVILLILVHVALFYLGVKQGANVLTDAIYSLGTLLESPAAFLVPSRNSRFRYNGSPSRPPHSTSSSTCCSASAAGHRAIRRGAEPRRKPLQRSGATTITYTSPDAFQNSGSRVVIEAIKPHEYRENAYFPWTRRRCNDRV